MSASGSTTNIALRPWPAPAKEKLEPVDIYTQIEQVARERGHLRYITEASLQNEIETGNKAAEDVMEGVEDATDDTKALPSKEDRQAELQEARISMIQAADFAAFNATNLLDLVALICSKDPSRNVSMSFSEMLKAQRLPPRTMGITKVVADQRPYEVDIKNYRDQIQHFAEQGSRMLALEKATDSILKAASQLETEIGKEVKYWDEILSISQKGWPLQKFRRGVRNSPFAVRYGHPEAGAQFKARGLAPLRMDEDGSIILDPALSLQPKTLRVRISENDTIVGTSRLPLAGSGTGLAIEKSIRLARDSQFEEELFHDISLETRQLLAYGVETRNSVVHITVPSSSSESGHRKILIDCIVRDDDIATNDDTSQDWLAQNVAEALRLLLSHDHRMRLFRRSQIPPPLTQQKRQSQPPPLLRTLIAVFSHLSGVKVLHDYTNQISKTLRNAGLTISAQTTREKSWEDLKSIIRDSSTPDLSAIDRLLETFLKPLDGVIKLSLPFSHSSETERLIIATRTFLGPPTFGTEFKVTIPPSIATALNLSQEQKRDFKFSSAEDVTSYIDWLLALDMTHNLLLKEFGKKASIRSKEPRVTVDVREGRKIFKKDVAVEIAGGKLEVSIGSTPLTLGEEGVQTASWDYTAEGTPFFEKVKSLIGG